MGDSETGAGWTMDIFVADSELSALPDAAAEYPAGFVPAVGESGIAAQFHCFSYRPILCTDVFPDADLGLDGLGDGGRCDAAVSGC